MKDIFSMLKSFVKGEVLINEPMKKHTTFKIGGNADYLIVPKDIDDIREVCIFAKNNSVPCMIIGNGSNLLVSDNGIRGIVIENKMEDISVCGTKIIAQSGAILSRISSIALKNELTGFEELSGIPGTIGGGVYMNAGAYGKEMKDVVKKVTYLNEEMELKTASLDELDFSYRHSMFSKRNCFIYEVELELEKGKTEEIKEKVKEISKKRKDKQPIEFPSGGSTFKRPTGYFAAALIEQAGLKGLKVGDAQVSTKHSGFVINLGDATCEDVLQLVEEVKQRVYNKFKVELDLEIKVID